MPIRISATPQTISVAILIVATALVIGCAADRTTQPLDLGQAGTSHILTPCDPTTQQCSGSGSPGTGIDTTLMPLCSASGGASAASTTPVSDSSIAVQVNGPLYIRSCRGPGVWTASTTGTAGGAYYRWYVSTCTGLYNYCGAPYSVALEGANQTTFTLTLGPDVRTFWVYVEAKDLAGRYLTGVSNKMFTKGPAFGADGGVAFNQPCFVADYPFVTEVDNGFTIDLPTGTVFVSDPNPQYYLYSRNYCNGNREWSPQTGSPTKPASPTDPPPPMNPANPLPKTCLTAIKC